MATKDTHGQSGEPWVGFDLDGTLAEYDQWRGFGHIGKPVPKMVAMIKAYKARGVKVKILTARVAPTSADPAKEGGGTKEEVMKVISDWCEKNIGFVPEITHEKDFLMVEFFDDRCTQVIPNSGEIVERKLAGEIDALRHGILGIYNQILLVGADSVTDVAVAKELAADAVRMCKELLEQK